VGNFIGPLERDTPTLQSSIAFCTEQRKPSIPRFESMDLPYLGSCTCRIMLMRRVMLALSLDASSFDNLLPLSDLLLKQPIHPIGHHILPYK
jgi:hypothetical protein